MQSFLGEQLQKCADVPSVINCALDCGLELTGTCFGNVQLVDWTSGFLEIKAQRGFEPEFLNFFARLKIEHGSACARALRGRRPIIIDDIMTDAEFSPYREIVSRAGVRAVQSTPLVSTSGALTGVLSTHFAAVRRPTDLQLRGLKEAAELAANAIVRVRASHRGRQLQSSLESIEQARQAIEDAEQVLARARRVSIRGD